MTMSNLNTKVDGDIRELEQLQADKRLVSAGSIKLDSKHYLVKVYPDEIVVVDVISQGLLLDCFAPLGKSLHCLCIRSYVCPVESNWQ